MTDFLTNFQTGAAGRLETLVDLPRDGVRGLALAAHPHPLFGGTMHNKVTQTLAKSFVRLGCATVRMNFRGVGASEGVFDNGQGETDDWLALLGHFRRQWPDGPLFLSGFSFGAYVMSEVARRVACNRLVLVGPAVCRFPLGTVPQSTLVIHGEKDTTIPLDQVMRWAEPQNLPIVVVPGADHFFHHRLGIIQEWTTLACRF